jgi:hypothetical protein
MAVALMLLASAVSGGYHLVAGALGRGEGSAPPRRAWAPLAAADVTRPPPAVAGSAVTVVGIAGEPWYRLQAARPADAHAHHVHPRAPLSAPAAQYVAVDATLRDRPAPDEALHARLLAGHFSGLPATAITRVTPVTAFGGEYGFVNKLLPVHRVDYDAPGHPRYYVHLDTAALATVIDDLDYIEGWTFAHLHKWQWLEFIGRWPRDLVMIAFALALAATAALGLRLFLRADG